MQLIAKKRIPMFLLCLTVAAGILGWIQFASPNLAGFDGYYHIKMALLTLQQGVPIDFPYLPMTIIDDERFLDMHMLFHILQAPFTWIGDLRLAAKISTVFYAALTFAVTAMVLARYEIRFPLAWTLLLFAVSSGFLYRVEMPRAPVFGLLFMVLAFHFIMQRKAIALTVLTVVFVWTYKGFPILIPIVVFGIFAHYLSAKTFEYRLGIAVIVGIAAGLVVNPYFPNNIQFLWGDLVLKIFSEGYVTNVGTEWFSYSVEGFFENAFGALFLYVAGLTLMVRRDWRLDPARMFWFLTATMWLVMMVKSKRFVEYFPPSALIFFAFSIRTWLRGVRLSHLSQPLMRLPIVLAIVLGVWAIYYNVDQARKDMRGEPSYRAYRGGAQWLAENTPKGARVFHTDWDDFPKLFFYNTHNTYIVGLDPDYMRLEDEKLYDLWSDISDGDIKRPEDAIRDTYGAGYVITDRDHRKFIRVAKRRRGRFKEVYSDTYTHVYKISPAPDLNAPKRRKKPPARQRGTSPAFPY